VEGHTTSQSPLFKKPEVQQGHAPYATTQHKEEYSARACRTSGNWLRYCTFCAVFHYQIRAFYIRC
jgi:hypothetical protein